MGAFGEELLEACFRHRRYVGPRDADRIEAARVGGLDQRGLDLGRVVQKSRLV
jgi:hypothetical protein